MKPVPGVPHRVGARAGMLGMMLLAGCAFHRQPRPMTAASSGPQRVGTIATVNEDLHFVLVDVGSLYAPGAGTALKSFSNGVETGILAVSPEKERPFIVADIIKGDPKIGDEVKE